MGGGGMGGGGTGGAAMGGGGMGGGGGGPTGHRYVRFVAKSEQRADVEVEANIAARTRGDSDAAERHLERGQQWLRVAEILRDLP